MGAVDRPAERVTLVGSQILAFARYVLSAPPTAMTCEDTRAWIGPTLTRYLTDPEPGLNSAEQRRCRRAPGRTAGPGAAHPWVKVHVSRRS